MKKCVVLAIAPMLVLVAFCGLAPDSSEHESASTPNDLPPLVNDAFMAGDMLEWENTKGTGYEPMLPAPGYYETSEYMMGDIAVGVILTESDGAGDPNLENWSAAEINNVKNEIQEGLDWWASVDPNATINFIYNFTYADNPVNISLEPILYPFIQHFTWVEETFSNIGYSVGNHFDRSRSYINDLRIAHETDWAFAVHVAASSINRPSFPGIIAYAYFGGPYTVMSYDNAGFGIANMDRVTAHETGHIFWAVDEYATSGCTVDDRSGYLNADNPNCENGGTGLPNIMLYNNLIVRPGTRKQIGWQDTDGDSVMDILDVPPSSSLSPYTPDPANDTTPTYTGTADVVAYPNSNPWIFNTGNNVTINTITDVEYRIDGGATQPWTSATPVDGAFDEDSEDYTFTAPTLSEGTYLFEVRTKTTVNGIDIYESMPYSLDVLTIDTGMPTSTVNLLPAFTKTPSFTVYVNASDGGSGSGIQKVELWYSTDGASYQLYDNDTAPPWSFNFDTTTTGGDGPYDFYSRAHDNVGNYEDAPAVPPDASTYVDIQKPVSSVDPLPQYSPSGFIVTATASDVSSGVQQVELWYKKDSGFYQFYSTDIASPWSFTFDAGTTGGSGTYDFCSIARDNAGNIENYPDFEDTSTIVVATKPSSVVDPLPSYTNTASFDVTVAITDAPSGLQKLELWYSKDGAAYALYGSLLTAPWTFDFDTSITGGEGTYGFYSIAFDNVGNWEDAPSPLVADTSSLADLTKPEIQIIAPSEGTWLSSTVADVEWAGLDTGSGIANYEIRLDGFPWFDVAFDTQHSFSDLSGGVHTVNVTVYDNATNSNTTSIIFNVDLTTPTIELTGPGNNTVVDSRSITLAWTGSDSESGIDHYEVQLDGGEYINVGLLNSYSFYQLREGAHTIAVKAVNNAGLAKEVSFGFNIELSGGGDDTDNFGSQIQDSWWIFLIFVSIILIGMNVLLAIVRRSMRKKREDEEYTRHAPEKRTK